VISSETLGSIFYELQLIAKSPLPEKTIKIKSSLGKFINFNVQLKNYSKESCEFAITVMNVMNYIGTNIYVQEFIMSF
jgi:hypothetical protein